MGANVAIALMKVLGWLLTGAASMLAEAIHSVADSANQILMLVGGKAAKKKATAEHPFGFGRDRYLSGFLVAMILFSMGGLFALYESYTKFQEVRAGHPNSLLESRWWWVAIVVLVGSMAAESFSLHTAVTESRPHKGKGRWFRFIRRSKAPELPVVLLEDTAALTGLTFALLGVVLTLVTGSGYFDVIGSGLIGLLLIVVAIILAIETQSLLIGEAAAPEAIARITEAIAGTDGVEGIVHMKTVHLGPEEILVAAKIAVPPGSSGVDVANLIDRVERRIRDAEPLVGPVYLEPGLVDPSLLEQGLKDADPLTTGVAAPE